MNHPIKHGEVNASKADASFVLVCVWLVEECEVNSQGHNYYVISHHIYPHCKLLKVKSLDYSTQGALNHIHA